jgi:small subunit ribosomal protein S6
VKRPYETCVLLDGTLTDQVIEESRGKIEAILNKGGSIDKVEVWGKRKIAYEIKKKKTGFYYLFFYQSETDGPAKLERHFKLEPAVLRYLTVQHDPSKVITPTMRPIDTTMADDAGGDDQPEHGRDDRDRGRDRDRDRDRGGRY